MLHFLISPRLRCFQVGLATLAVVVGLLCVTLASQGQEQAATQAQGAAPAQPKVQETGNAPLQPVTAEAAVPELAYFMGELQRLTHKMALAADAGNAELANFYLFECLEQLTKIQEEAPEYEGQPIALLIDRMALPLYEPLKEAVAAKPANRERMMAGVNAVIQGCNGCHAATLHPFIRITAGTEVNPFNQSFQP